MDPNTNEVVSFLTHHVRTSLSSMLGFVETLYDSQQTTKEKFSHLSKIRTLIEQTATTLEDLQHLAAIEKGSLSIRSTQFSLEEELNDTVHILKSIARKNQLNLQIQPEGKIPSVILSDALRLRQLLTNLVSFFLSQTEQGTVRLTLGLTSDDPPRLYFRVDATGPNLSEEYAKEFFDKPHVSSLFSLPIIHGQHAISLSLIKALTLSLGGKIALPKSTLGKGRTICISIDPGPIHASHLTDSFMTREIEQSPNVRSIEVPNFSDKRILIVEDDPDIASLFVHFLKRTGAQVKHASDGDEGIKEACLGHYNLIFLDLQLPKINGLEVCSRIRKQGVQTPIVALTANTSLEAKRKCFQVGCNLYMTKPVSIESLFQIIPKVAP